MSNPNVEESGGARFVTVQPQRDLQANWEVDLAKKLEEYLIKVCSGEIAGVEVDDVSGSVNFAEAALLLQGSVQVYSRKVEYLYSLVLNALEFILQKRQQDQADGTSVQPEESRSCADSVEVNDRFWGLDDIAVEPKNCLDSLSGKDAPFDNFVKPPANLVVLEGDCLDASGDGGELEAYLLATNDLYRDFILLDPCDAVSVDEFLVDKAPRGQSGAYRESSTHNIQSPTRRSGGTAHKSSARRGQDANVDPSPIAGGSFDVNNFSAVPDPPAFENHEAYNHGFDINDRYSDPGGPDNLDEDEEDDDDDPWNHLNPHEPGNKKIKSFRKVKNTRKNAVNCTKMKSTLLAKLDGMTNAYRTESWERFSRNHVRQRGSQSPPLYEKLRQVLVNGKSEKEDAFPIPEESEDFGTDDGIPDFEPPDYDMPENVTVDDVPVHQGKPDDSDVHDINDTFGHEDMHSNARLEDLCRSHLDALLASIAETEKLTDMAARISTWKQNIEHNLDEQEQRPPFDIHEYGERILNKLSHEGECNNAMSFTEVVKGQEKHDVARHFSALLQLVNNGDVNLEKNNAGETVCYTDLNPFHVRLLRRKKREKPLQFHLSSKRVKSPIKKADPKADGHDSRKKQRRLAVDLSSRSKRNLSAATVNTGGERRSPDSKRRRKSRLVNSAGLQSSG